MGSAGNFWVRCTVKIIRHQSIPAAARVDLLNSIAYLRLASFDGAKQYGDFDAEWSGLDAAQRAQINLVELGVANARCRDLHDRVDQNPPARADLTTRASMRESRRDSRKSSKTLRRERSWRLLIRPWSPP